MERKLIGYYNYTVVLTYIGMLSGFYGIINAMNGKVYTAVICLIISGVCDMFDGAIAATRERNRNEKTFGIQIDSLSDLICFGVLPAVIVTVINESSQVACVIAGFYVLCALIRLAYYNVDEQNRQLESSGRREFYTGLPVTTSAIILPLAFLVTHFMKVEMRGVGTALLFVVAVLFITPFQMKKIKVVPGHKDAVENEVEVIKN